MKFIFKQVDSLQLCCEKHACLLKIVPLILEYQLSIILATVSLSTISANDIPPKAHLFPVPPAALYLWSPSLVCLDGQSCALLMLSLGSHFSKHRKGQSISASRSQGLAPQPVRMPEQGETWGFSASPGEGALRHNTTRLQASCPAWAF